MNKLELQRFKETLLEFLADVTTIPDENKDLFFSGHHDSLFDAPYGYKVLSDFVLVKIEEVSRVEPAPQVDCDSLTKHTEEPEYVKPKLEVLHSRVNFKIYTESNIYSISGVWDSYVPTYLGCIASTRKARAGEWWNRGNDLPDGHFCRETWEDIKDRIIRYEMCGLSKYIANGHYDKPQTNEDIGPQEQKEEPPKYND